MYNDYMQNVFGSGFFPYYNTYESSITRNNNFVGEIENYYPEIYNVIYPMIKKICTNCSCHITEDILNEMTDEIYNNLETDNILNLNISVETSKNETRLSSNSSNNTRINNSENNNNNNNNRNYNSIRDLIKILLIRELIEKSNK